MAQRLRAITLVALTAAVAGLRLGQEPKTYYWAGKNGDSLRTGSSHFTSPSDLSKGPSWSFHEDYFEHGIGSNGFRNWIETIDEGSRMGLESAGWKGLVRTAPLIDDEKNIYLTTVTLGRIYKFTSDGKMLWTYQSDGAIPDIPTIDNGRLFAHVNVDGGKTGGTVAIDMKTGQEVWRVVGEDLVSAGDTWSMVSGDGIVISAVIAGGTDNNNHGFVARHWSNGSETWRYNVEGPPIYNILVAIKDGSCVFSDSSGRVHRLDLQTGKKIWETPKKQLPSFTTGGSVIGENGVIYTTWNELVPCGPGGPQGSIFGACQTGKVGAFRFSDGTPIWTYDTEGYEANNGAAVGRMGRTGKPFVAIGIGSNPNFPDTPTKQNFPGKGKVYDGVGPEHKARIVALDAETGKLLWLYELEPWHGSALGDDKRPDICLPDAFGNAAISGDGTVYVGFQSGTFYGVGDSNEDGHISESEVSAWPVGAAFQGSPGIAPGMVVATPCNGMHVWNA